MHMSPELVELALRKQRLQFRAATQRDDLARRLGRLQPVFTGINQVQDGALWLRRHPALVAGAASLLLVTRPRTALRWARRAWGGWQLFVRLRKLL